MSKTSEQVLVEEVQEELTAFLSSGKINEKELSRALSFEDLDIKDFDRLKEIHFVLSKPVTDFVKDLPEWIRRIKTESYREKKTSRGEVRGRIDWGETFKTRYSQNHKDKSVFVTQNPDIEYNIPENLVLKKVLSIIYRVVTKEVEEIKHDWRTEFWDEEEITSIREIFQRNVNIDRIQDMEDQELTSKQLEAARNSRREVYRGAYKLYRNYEKIMENKFSDEEIQKLLENTLIVPNRMPKLFELFSTFKVIRDIEQSQELELKAMEGDDSKIAVMENDEKKVFVFHDSTGNLEFNQEIPDNPEDDFTEKSKEIADEHEDSLNKFIGRESQKGLYSGRPDIVIEEYNTSEGNEPEKVTIGEVKYTDRESTFSQGLRELLEYMKFGTFNDIELDDLGVEGIIVADNISLSENSCNQTNITAETFESIKN